MIKRFLSSLIILLISISSNAATDNYSSLWKQVEDAQRKDLPATQLKVLRHIADKAARERAYGHLMKAQIQSVYLKGMLSPDSLLPAVRRVETLEHQAASSDAVLAAVYQSVLGRLYHDNPSIVDSAAQKSTAYYKQSLSRPDLLAAARTASFVPLVDKGVDSRIFNNDMLHVLSLEAGDCTAAHDYYLAAGNRSAACIMALKQAEAKWHRSYLDSNVRQYINTLDSLTAVYIDLPEAARIAIERYRMMDMESDVKVDERIVFIDKAIERWGSQQCINTLRNARSLLTQPSIHVQIDDCVVPAGQPVRIAVSQLRNVKQLRLTLRRLNVTGETELNPEIPKQYAKLAKLMVPGTAYSETRRYDPVPDYKIFTDTIEMKGQPTGVYLLDVASDNAAMSVSHALVYISNLYVLSEKLPDNNTRFVVTDAMTGLPVKGAQFKMFTFDRTGRGTTVDTFTSDDNGEIKTVCSDRANLSYYVSTENDKSHPKTGFYSYFNHFSHTDKRNYVRLYTDRGIYRPGQTVHVAALAYDYNPIDISCSALARQALTLTLRDANNNEVASHKVVTDGFGMASADFVVPKDGLTGSYSVRSDAGIFNSISFSVEEYKRPTFIVEFDTVKQTYQAGDTVCVSGTVKSYAGVPVQGARVTYKVSRRQPWFWSRYADNESSAVLASDTVVTDNEGRFAVRVPVIVPECHNSIVARFYSFAVRADVTDMSGETRSGEISLPYGSRPTLFECNMPETLNRDSINNVVFEYKNMAGEKLEADVTYLIDDRKYSCKTNTPTVLPVGDISSGRHELKAYCGNDTITRPFVSFSLNDERLAHDTHDWFYLSSDQFSADGRPVHLQAGSSDSLLYVVYSVVADNRILESGSTRLDGGRLLNRDFTYKPEYGDGISLALAWVKNGRAYNHTAIIKRPVPDTRLILKWKTFRDRLTPGQKEEWTLNISRPDGKQAEAQLMALLYDKSLDQIRKHSWSFPSPVSLNLPYLTWSGRMSHACYLDRSVAFKQLREKSLIFSRFDIQPMYVVSKEECSMLGTFDLAEQPRATMVRGSAPRFNNLMAKSMNSEVITTGFARKQDAGGIQEEAQTDEPTSAQPQLRENLAETAFFFPGLVTDDNGDVNIRFTLPESITTWQFRGFAHDKKMNNGMLESECVAKKTVMVQPNMPRFVRPEDLTVISAKIMNTSENSVSGKAELLLLNPETEKVVFRQQRNYTVEANQTDVVSFDVDMANVKNDGLLVCRIMASGNGYSDGEQHYLPVLPDKELVTNTLSFTQNQPGTMAINLKNLFDVKDSSNRLTVEYTDNPAWLMIQTLLSVAQTDETNAVSLAAAYYANSIGLSIMNSSPVIKQTVQLWQKELDDNTSLTSNLQKNEELKSLSLKDTPWFGVADKETEQKQRLAEYFDESAMSYRLADNIAKLKKLQNADGSFSWWPGMFGSRYMTQMIVETLVRLNAMTGVQNETSAMLTSAFSFLNKEMAKEVTELRKAEKKGNKVAPGESAVNYLYICSIDANRHQYIGKSDMDYLLNLLEKQNSQYSIYGKARTAVIMGKNHRETKARELLQSIKEYTVYKEDMGRYFDTPKALYSWFDYRIPSQVSAIEALNILTPEDVNTVTEMQRWLLQAKRTQGWDTPINTVNAVYAFLNGNMSRLKTTNDKPATLKLDGKTLETPKSTAGLGYVKTAKTGDKMNKLTVEKTTDGTSWGAVYAQFMQPVTDVKDSSTGLTIVRDIIKNGEQVSTNGSVALNVGDKVTVRITIVANRDYDFVQISDKRAACLEPVKQLSGYRSGYYCAPKDNVTNYYFDRLSKGKHVVETDYHVDRAGRYTTGTCTVQCAYSPDFSARGAALKIQTAN